MQEGELSIIIDDGYTISLMEVATGHYAIR